MDTETRRGSWAPVAMVVAVATVLAMVVWGIDRYWGGDGVRLTGIVLGIAAICAFITIQGIGVMWVAFRMTMRHHDNVLQGLVDFQQADDRGEVARTVATGISGALRSGNQLDRSVLQLAGRLGTQQANAIVGAQKQLAQQAGGPTWAMHPGAEVEGDFKMVQ